MAPRLSDLGTTPVPNASQLGGVQAYLAAYQSAYQRLAARILEASGILQDKYNVNFPDSHLLAVLNLTVRESLPEGIESELDTGASIDTELNPTFNWTLNHKKLEALIQDVERLTGNTSFTRNTFSQCAPPYFKAQLVLYMHSGMPMEEIKFSINKGEKKIGDGYSPGQQFSMTEYDSLPSKDSAQINEVLANLDTSDSAIEFQIGYKRLVLMDVLLKNLVADISLREEQAKALTRRLETLL